LLAVVGLILFVAMIGAISLTYIASENYRTQHVPTQTQLQIVKSYRLSSGVFLTFFTTPISSPILVVGLMSLFIAGYNFYNNKKYF